MWSRRKVSGWAVMCVETAECFKQGLFLCGCNFQTLTLGKESRGLQWMGDPTPPSCVLGDQAVLARCKRVVLGAESDEEMPWPWGELWWLRDNESCFPGPWRPPQSFQSLLLVQKRGEVVPPSVGYALDLDSSFPLCYL